VAVWNTYFLLLANQKIGILVFRIWILLDSARYSIFLVSISDRCYWTFKWGFWSFFKWKTNFTESDPVCE
jgi:hypothetical protein